MLSLILRNVILILEFQNWKYDQDCEIGQSQMHIMIGEIPSNQMQAFGLASNYFTKERKLSFLRLSW